MRVLNFSLIMVLSCVAMIGAIPVGSRAPAEAIVRRQSPVVADVEYVPYYLQLQHVEVLTWSKNFSSAKSSMTSVSQLVTCWVEKLGLFVASLLSGP